MWKSLSSYNFLSMQMLGIHYVATTKEIHASMQAFISMISACSPAQIGAYGIEALV